MRIHQARNAFCREMRRLAIADEALVAAAEAQAAYTEAVQLEAARLEAARLEAARLEAAQAQAAQLEADQMEANRVEAEEENAADEQAEEDWETVSEGEGEQEQVVRVAQPTTLIGKAWAGVKEFLGAILKLIQWMLKITYSFMILCIGFTNIYFLYLYLAEKAPIINKATYLISPNFEEEFRLM